jgi:hypothetical protein
MNVEVRRRPPCTLLGAFDTVELDREAFLRQNIRMKQEVRDVFVSMRTHMILVKVSVWPRNNGAM